MSPEQPQLTSYIHGELSVDEASAVETSASTQAEIRSELEMLRKTEAELARTFAAQMPMALRPSQRAAIIAASRVKRSAAKNIARFPVPNTFYRTWKLGFAAAAAVTLGAFFLTRTSHSSKKNLAEASTNHVETWRQLPLNIRLMPAPGPVDHGFAQQSHPVLRYSSQSPIAKTTHLAQNKEFLKRLPLPLAADLPTLSPRLPVLASRYADLPLPLEAGSSSLGWVTQSVRGEGKLPSTNAVRIEEILNSFPLTPAGSTAKYEEVSISTETLACPWKPAATLLLVSIQGAPSRAVEVATSFQADPTSVLRYRLLGFANVTGGKITEMPQILKAGAKTLLAIEIETNSATVSFGNIALSVDKSAVIHIPLKRNIAAEPSDDSRFAALICTYGQWLSSDPAGKVESETLVALSKEITTKSLAPDRHDFLELINQSLRL